MNKFTDFLNTAFGSYLKVFLTTILSLISLKIYEDHLTILQIVTDVKIVDQIITAGIFSIIPIWINSMNPKDKRYGKKVEKLPNLPKDKVN